MHREITFSVCFSQFSHRVDHPPPNYKLTIEILLYHQFNIKQNVKDKTWCQFVKIIRRPFAFCIQKTRLSDIFNVILRAWLWCKNFFFQFSSTAIWHFILDVTSYLLSKTTFTVPLKNESPHGREVKKRCFIIPQSKEPC